MIQKDAADILEFYKTRLDKIPNGQIPGIYVPYLPTYIICDNDQVLRLRRRKKVLQIPDFIPLSKEEKISRIMLFYPLRKGQDIDTDRLGIMIWLCLIIVHVLISDSYYYARDPNGTKDSNGITLTIIQENERLLICIVRI